MGACDAYQCEVLHSYTDFVAGYITENLPDYLLNKESVNCLNLDYAVHHNNNAYQDKLCFFRCLAYHKLKHDKNHKLMCIGQTAQRTYSPVILRLQQRCEPAQKPGTSGIGPAAGTGGLL